MRPIDIDGSFFMAMDTANNIKEKNELDYTCGISDDRLTELFIESIRLDNEERKIKGLPIYGYDIGKMRPYLEYADGRRQYV